MVKKDRRKEMLSIMTEDNQGLVWSCRGVSQGQKYWVGCMGGYVFNSPEESSEYRILEEIHVSEEER